MKKNKPIYVLNATPIIHFAKISKLNLILEICEAYITHEVYFEVTKKKNFSNSLIAIDTVKSGKLKVYDVKDKEFVQKLLRHPEIHKGEAETIVAAKELEGIAIIDDKEARSIAKLYKVKTAPGCLFLLFRLLKLKKIRSQGTYKMLEELVHSGLYLDSITLLKARKRIEKYTKETKTK